MNRKGKTKTVYSSQKILLLDDNRDLLQIVQIILKGQGYDTVLASSIEEARLKIRIHKPVLILMDVCLSDQDGYSFCSDVKNDPEMSHVRVIMMSGEEYNQNMISYAHADDFMQKPFDYNDLVGRVQKHYTGALEITA
ncbi:MAG: PleD family two-component system response regulator [Cytophagaceae bacterium]